MRICKMKLISCENIRRLVVISTSFLVIGILMFLSIVLFSNASSSIFGISFLYLALTLILTSPLVLAINLMLSILPGSKQILEHCNH